jgi:hypothetical protein
LAVSDASVIGRFGRDGAGHDCPGDWVANNWPVDEGFQEASASAALGIARTDRFSDTGVATDSTEMDTLSGSNCGSTDGTTG